MRVRVVGVDSSSGGARAALLRADGIRLGGRARETREHVQDEAVQGEGVVCVADLIENDVGPLQVEVAVYVVAKTGDGREFDGNVKFEIVDVLAAWTAHLIVFDYFKP